MADKKDIKSIMEKLLEQKTSGAENEFLTESGFKTKGATKFTVLAAALYKKAAGGDMSALKEIRSILSSGSAENSDYRVVTIIDDTTSKDI